jgi:hypothetical protein
MAKKKKSLFDRAIDALTDRDEKEAAAEAARARVVDSKSVTKDIAPQKEAAEQSAAKAVADKAAVQKAAADRVASMKAASEKAAAERAAAAPQKGIVTVRSLRIRADHSTSSEVVGGLLEGQEVIILDTWSDGKNIWAKLDKGWAAMLYDGEPYIQLA